MIDTRIISPAMPALRYSEAVARSLQVITQQARVRSLRTMAQFAEDDIIIPTGPFAGLPFRIDRQPFARLWFHEVDAGRWRRLFWTGPQQSSKTLLLVIALMYHLFEIEETAIFGIPTLDLVGQKWERDIKPVIEASRYRDMIPSTGTGSRGGRVEQITFRNGVTLLFRTDRKS